MTDAGPMQKIVFSYNLYNTTVWCYPNEAINGKANPQSYIFKNKLSINLGDSRFMVDQIQSISTTYL